MNKWNRTQERALRNAIVYASAIERFTTYHYPLFTVLLSLLEPLLVLIYTNALDGGISSDINKFADDTKIGR